MSHHGNNPFDEDTPTPEREEREKLMADIFQKVPPSSSELHKAMARVIGEFPDGKLTTDDEGGLAMEIGTKDGRVRLGFSKPVGWIAFTPEEAIKIAQSLIENARKAGLKTPFSLRIGGE